MNPPFTRTCGDNLLFGSLPKTRTHAHAKSVPRMVQAATAWRRPSRRGWAQCFLTAADRCLKPDGRLAFVLPKALLSGDRQWQLLARTAAAEHYTLEYLIVSHDPARWHFSENTDLSETLFGARKASDGGGMLCLNLWRNPDNPVDALLLAEEARKLAPAGNTLQTFDSVAGRHKVGRGALPA
jgi:hypothetical protein